MCVIFCVYIQSTKYNDIEYLPNFVMRGYLSTFDTFCWKMKSVGDKKIKFMYHFHTGIFDICTSKINRPFKSSSKFFEDLNCACPKQPFKTILVSFSTTRMNNYQKYKLSILYPLHFKTIKLTSLNFIPIEENLKQPKLFSSIWIEKTNLWRWKKFDVIYTHLLYSYKV